MLQLRFYILLIFVFFLPFSSAIVNTVIGVLIGLWILDKIITRDVKLFRVFRIPVAAFLVILLFAGLSFINTADVRASYQGMAKLLKWMFLFFVVSDTVRTQKQFVVVIGIWCVSAFLVSLDGLYQYFTGFDFLRHNPIQYFNPGIFRVRALYSHATLLAGYLDPIFSPLMILGLFYFRGIKQLLFLMFSLVIGICFILTWTRIAVIAVALAFFILWIIRRNFMLPIIMILIWIGGYFFLPSKMVTWIHEQNNLIQILFNDDRMWTMQAGMSMMKAHPWIGVGVNTFSGQYKYYKVPQDPFDFGYSANSYIHMGGEIGMTAMVSLFVFLFWLFYRGSKAYFSFQDPLIKVLFLGVLGALLIYFFHGFMDNNLYFSKLTPLMGFLTGLTASHVHIKKDFQR